MINPNGASSTQVPDVTHGKPGIGVQVFVTWPDMQGQL